LMTGSHPAASVAAASVAATPARHRIELDHIGAKFYQIVQMLDAGFNVRQLWPRLSTWASVPRSLRG
jgi:hypothetical protein